MRWTRWSAIISAKACKGHLVADRESYHHGNLRQALVEATAGLIEEVGPQSFTMAEAARRAGSEAVILIGDPPYYMPLGFEKVAWKALEFPGPVDPARVLVVPLGEDVHERLKGLIAWRPAEAKAAADAEALRKAS